MSVFKEGLPDYYHYRWINAVSESSVQSAMSLLEDTKESILSSYISKYSNALVNFQNQNGINLTNEQSSILDFAADGSITPQDLESIISKSMVSSPISGEDLGGGQQLISAVQKLNTEVQNSNKKLVDFSILMESFTEATDIYQQVQDAILGAGGNLTLSARSKSIIVQRVVRQILSSPNGTAWRKNLKGGKIAGLSTSLNQWLILLYALTNNQVPRGSKTAVKEAILNTIQNNFNNLVKALGEVGTITASTVGTVQLIEKLNSSLKEMESQIKGKNTGSKTVSYSVDIDNDAYSLSVLSNLKGQLLALNGKQLSAGGDKITLTFPSVQVKTDQEVWSSELQANINNVTVKTTNNVKTLKSGEQRLGSITVQNSTSLLSLLYKELNFSSKTIIGFLQIAMANESNEPDIIWGKLKQYIQTAMIIPALTGIGKEMGGTDNLATMIKINDYLIPMSSFINYLQGMILLKGNGLGQEFTGYITLEGFPSRSTFTKINGWQPPQRNNWAAAKRRSYLAETNGMNMLQSIKLRMRLRNLNLSLLAKSAI